MSRGPACECGDAWSSSSHLVDGEAGAVVDSGRRRR
jgi:hypothetical protein